MSDHRRRTLLVALVGLVVLFAFVPAASAHAFLEDTEPGAGEQLESLPSALTLTYSGDGIEAAAVEVYGPDGDLVSGDTIIDSEDPQRVTVNLSDAGEGMYIVDWEVLATDGHTTSDTFFFVVGEELDPAAILAAQSAGPDTGIDWLEAVGNVLVLLGIIGLVGISVTALTAVLPVLGRNPEAADTASQASLSGSALSDPDRFNPLDRLDSPFRLALASVVVTLLVGILIQGTDQIMTIGSITAFLETTVGMIWLVQLLVAVGLSAFLAIAIRGRFSRRQVLGAALVGGSLAALSVAATSHAVPAVGQGRGTVVSAAHLLGASLWVGGLVTIALAVTVIRAEPAASQPQLIDRLVRRYSVLAIAGVALLLASGLQLAVMHVGTTDRLWSSPYGIVLVTKLALVALALAFAGYSRYVLLPRFSPHVGLLRGLLGGHSQRTDGGTPPIGRFLTTVRLELLVLVCVILLSGAMTAMAPAALGDPEVPTTTLTEDRSDDVAVEVTVTPVDLEDEHMFMVLVDELVVVEATFYRDGRPVVAEDVMIQANTFDLETVIDTDLEADGDVYRGVMAFSETGVWDLQVRGHVDSQFDAVEFGVHVHPHVPGAEHDHGESSSEFPFGLVSVIVLIYGALAVIYEGQQVRRRRDG